MEIAHCKNVQACFKDKNIDCKEIVQIQGKHFKETFQLPEPWNGDIRNAPIMFLSSNPGIKPDEVFPTWSKGLWPDDRVVDFFTNRFGGGEKEWKDEDGKSLYNDGKYKGGAKFWGSIKNTVATIRRENKKKITLREAAKHFSSTEIVHCKSKSEKGVKKAKQECTEKYLNRVLNISRAKIVICLGEKVRKVMQKKLLGPSIKLKLPKYKNMHLYRDNKNGKTKRIYIFLPHPSAGKKNKLKGSLLYEVRQFAKKYCVAN